MNKHLQANLIIATFVIRPAYLYSDYSRDMKPKRIPVVAVWVTKVVSNVIHRLSQ